MALDPGGRSGPRLDHVGIERSLHEEPRVGDVVVSSGLERSHELLADDLPLGLRIRHPRQLGEEDVLAIQPDQRDVEVPLERLHHLVGFTGAKESRIDEDAGQVLPDRLVDQQRGHGRVDPARQPADGPALSDLQPDAFDRPLDHVGRSPLGQQPARVVQEPLENLEPPKGVRHLGVELHSEEPASLILHGRHGRGCRPRRHPKGGWGVGHRVRVTHPDGFLGREVLEQHPPSKELHGRAAVLAQAGWFDPSTQRLGHRLLPVADAQHRSAEVEQTGVDCRSPRLIDRCGAARQDQTGRAARLQLCERCVERNDLGVDVALANSPRDQLGILRAEVDHQHGSGFGQPDIPLQG